MSNKEKTEEKTFKKTREKLMDEWKSDFNNFYPKHIKYEDIPEVEEKSTEDIRHKILKDDHDALNKVLLETLSPELKNNEIQKRSFKQKLIKYIKYLVLFQLVLVAIPILSCCVAVCFDISIMNDLTNESIEVLFGFLKYYISVVIVEFLAMLFFIVKYVFDKSIVDLTGVLLEK